MASRTVVDSVKRVDSPPDNLTEIEQELAQLRARFPGVIFDRYLDQSPKVAEDTFIAPGAAVVGSVKLGARASIWYGCVLRGDVNRIEIGENSNLQDGTVVHLGDHDPTLVAEDVVVGHRAVLHGCKIGGGCLIGIQATVLDGAVIGEGSIVGAGALVTAGTQIPPRSLVLGMPAKVVKSLGPEDEKFHRQLAMKYVRISHNYRQG